MTKALNNRKPSVATKNQKEVKNVALMVFRGKRSRVSAVKVRATTIIIC